MTSSNTQLIKPVNFVQDVMYPHDLFDQSPRYHATYKHGDIRLSIGYGGGMYGSGPSSDTYEMHMWMQTDKHGLTDDKPQVIQLDGHNDAVGWCDMKQVTHVINLMHEDQAALVGCLAG